MLYNNTEEGGIGTDGFVYASSCAFELSMYTFSIVFLCISNREEIRNQEDTTKCLKQIFIFIFIIILIFFFFLDAAVYSLSNMGKTKEYRCSPELRNLPCIIPIESRFTGIFVARAVNSHILFLSPIDHRPPNVSALHLHRMNGINTCGI